MFVPVFNDTFESLGQFALGGVHHFRGKGVDNFQIASGVPRDCGARGKMLIWRPPLHTHTATAQ